MFLFILIIHPKYYTVPSLFTQTQVIPQNEISISISRALFFISGASRLHKNKHNSSKNIRIVAHISNSHIFIDLYL